MADSKFSEVDNVDEPLKVPLCEAGGGRSLCWHSVHKDGETEMTDTTVFLLCVFWAVGLVLVLRKGLRGRNRMKLVTSTRDLGRLGTQVGAGG